MNSLVQQGRAAQLTENLIKIAVRSIAVFKSQGGTVTLKEKCVCLIFIYFKSWGAAELSWPTHHIRLKKTSLLGTDPKNTPLSF